MMSIKKHIPNFITSLNLVCGTIAIMFLIHNQIAFASVMVFAAAIFDFFDGMAARLLHVKSEIGKQLDSLADMVSFGLVPAMILYRLLAHFTLIHQGAFWQFLPYLSILIPVFSALRLAKFNIDTRQEDAFIGIPTPATALFIASLDAPLGLYAHLAQYPFLSFAAHPLFLAGTALFFSFMMVAEVPLFSLKFKTWAFKGNQIRYTLIIISAILLAKFSVFALSLIILIYVLLSLIHNVLQIRKR
jgi:CDP-diacylglycerol--serine O-phosphatidyltransferase